MLEEFTGVLRILPFVLDFLEEDMVGEFPSLLSGIGVGNATKNFMIVWDSATHNLYIPPSLHDELRFRS